MATLGVIFGILGSLGIFLFGMKVMSQGLQRVAGGKLRRIMAGMTRTRIAGVLTGFLVTSIVQSSSATTVMVVSFVNARLLKLREAIGVIMGANLGTTTTFWIIAYFGFSKFSLTALVMPVIAFGFPLIFSRKPRLRDTGETLIGFGLLFMGLGLLKDALPDVRTNPEALQWLQSYTSFGFGSVLLFLLVGVLLTVLVQSSSVAGAITLTMAYKGWIDFEIAAAIVLGENIGTTITANLAALAANTPAKRAARAHLMFNVIGVCWMLLLFYPFTRLVQAIPMGVEGAALPHHLALFHSLFNLCNICLLIGFVPRIENLVDRLVKGPDDDTDGDLAALVPFIIGMGELSLKEAQEGLKNLGALALGMFRGCRELEGMKAEAVEGQVNRIHEAEDQSDRDAASLNEFLAHSATDAISRRSAHAVAVMGQVISELEAACDCCYRLSRRMQKLFQHSAEVTAEKMEELEPVSKDLEELLALAVDKLSAPLTPGDHERIDRLQRSVREGIRTLRRGAIERLQPSSDPEAELLFIEMLTLQRRVYRHALNITQMMAKADWDEQ